MLQMWAGRRQCRSGGMRRGERLTELRRRGCDAAAAAAGDGAGDDDGQLATERRRSLSPAAATRTDDGTHEDAGKVRNWTIAGPSWRTNADVPAPPDVARPRTNVRRAS